MTAAPTDEPVAPERVLSATVEAAERGERLDRLLARRFGDLSRTRLKHLVEAGQVSVDGATIKDPSLRVKPGQRCAVTLPPPVADRPEAQAMSLDIRYEDAEHRAWGEAPVLSWCLGVLVVQIFQLPTRQDCQEEGLRLRRAAVPLRPPRILRFLRAKVFLLSSRS